MSLCDCGCGFKVGSPEFIHLHVESKVEREQRETCEQYQTEQDALEE